MPGLVRTFVGLPVTEPALVAGLSHAQETLRDVRGIAWVKPALFHFTLRFLGEIPEERVAAASRAVATLEGSGAFDLALGGLGTFPPGRPARVVWAGCAAGTERLVSLAARVEAALEGAGFPSEERPFSPHLTLGRVKDPRAGRDAARRVGEMRPEPLGTMRAGSVVLVRSVLGPDGPAYTPIRIAAL